MQNVRTLNVKAVTNVKTVTNVKKISAKRKNVMSNVKNVLQM